MLLISRQIGWKFFSNELMMIVNTNSNNNIWLEKSKNYHILAQLNSEAQKSLRISRLLPFFSFSGTAGGQAFTPLVKSRFIHKFTAHDIRSSKRHLQVTTFHTKTVQIPD